MLASTVQFSNNDQKDSLDKRDHSLRTQQRARHTNPSDHRVPRAEAQY